MKVYHFDLGNSSTGPIGFCASVKASSQEEALAILKDSLPEELEVVSSSDRVEYIQVYFNDEAITVKNIDIVEES